MAARAGARSTGQGAAMAERVLMAMSGGVDSSVAAALLHEAGHEVVGVTLHLWDASGAQQVGRCCAPEDREDARRSADALGIPHYVLDEREAFAAEVVAPFVEGYLRGTTPSPCVVCNQHVKLGRLAAVADRLGCTRIGTGHYARIERDPSGLPRLLRGVDGRKDQSYFLHGVPSAILARLVLPLGGLTKDQTRSEGRRLGVPNWDKTDSQELCFVPDGDIAGFVRARAPGERSGRIIDETGAELGTHAGLEAFTVGQRRGLGLGGGPPRYVLRIVPETREVVVGQGDALGAGTLRAREVTWLREVPEAFEAAVQIRHHHTPAPARIERDPAGFRATFASPQRAVSPGQAAVVYLGEEVLGGGIIS
jgi:tRNA-specific 2-thiouridylase